MSLQEKFTAIDTVLQYYHSTTRTPIPLCDLQTKVFQRCALAISRNDLDRVNEMLPGAYQITEVRRKVFVECKQLPEQAVARQNRFAQVYASDSLREKNSKSSESATSSPVARPDSLRRPQSSASIIVKGRIEKCSPRLVGNRPKSAPSMDALLERVRAKQAHAQSLPLVDAAQARVNFLISQLPSIINIIRALTTGTASFSLPELVQRISQSLSTKLSTSEIHDAVRLLASRMPHFCQVMSVGKLTVVKINCRASPAVNLVSVPVNATSTTTPSLVS